MLFALWMCIVPQVMTSTTVIELCEEVGSAPLPLIEEEEVKHVGTEPPANVKAMATIGPRILLIPAGTDRPHVSLHGEVPHLPPWC